MSPRPRMALGHAARVAAVTTAIIAALYLAIGGILDVVVVHRLTAQVDARLTQGLRDADTHPGQLPDMLEAGRSVTRDLDDAPLLFWRVNSAGGATTLTAGAPSLPVRAWSAATPLTAQLAGTQVRLDARRESYGWLVAGQSLAQANHVRTVLLVAEGVVAPLLLLAIYLGSLAIGVRAAAPVERTRRRQLEFSADASHELRTPLSVIEAEVGLALSSPRDNAYYRFSLERVGQESKRLRHIVEDLLWLARFDAEPPPPGDEPVDLLTGARRCAERFAPLADARGLRLSVREEGSDRALVRAPPEWIDRLLGVLVDNACRYSPAGGSVSIVVACPGARAMVAVDDDGPGIPEAERDRLFDRFHRASEQPGGAGLGLAIADSVVRVTGGRWRIASSPSGGAHMEVSWPRAGGPERGPLRAGSEPERLPAEV